MKNKTALKKEAKYTTDASWTFVFFICLFICLFIYLFIYLLGYLFSYLFLTRARY